MKKHLYGIGIGFALVLGGLVGCGGTGANSSLWQLQASQDSQALSLEDQSLSKLSQGIDLAIHGDYPGAIRAYDQALQLDAHNSEIYYNRGVAYYSVGNPQQALKDFNQVIQLDPDFAEAYGNRGAIRLAQGDYQGALSDFRLAADLFSQQGEPEAAAQMQLWIQQSSALDS